MDDLLQDGPGCAETRRLALWFATRMDAMWLVRRWAYERSSFGTGSTPNAASHSAADSETA